MATVNPNDPRPPYVQIADDLRSAITGGTLKPGDRIGSGRELAKRYGVAPMTVTNAISALRDEGLLTSWQGRGVFVATRYPRRAATSETGWLASSMSSWPKWRNYRAERGAGERARSVGVRWHVTRKPHTRWHQHHVRTHVKSALPCGRIGRGAFTGSVVVTSPAGGEANVSEPNDALAALIAEARLSWAGLARRINDLGANEGLALRYDYTAVNRWVKRGERPASLCRDCSPAPSLSAWAAGSVRVSSGWQTRRRWQSARSGMAVARDRQCKRSWISARPT